MKVTVKRRSPPYLDPRSVDSVPLFRGIIVTRVEVEKGYVRGFCKHEHPGTLSMNDIPSWGPSSIALKWIRSLYQCSRSSIHPSVHACTMNGYGMTPPAYLNPLHTTAPLELNPISIP
ncbi:hypothetical protein ACLOJK_011606 [Asimina triloba]